MKKRAQNDNHEHSGILLVCHRNARLTSSAPIYSRGLGEATWLVQDKFKMYPDLDFYRFLFTIPLRGRMSDVFLATILEGAYYFFFLPMNTSETLKSRDGKDISKGGSG